MIAEQWCQVASSTGVECNKPMVLSEAEVSMQPSLSSGTVVESPKARQRGSPYSGVSELDKSSERALSGAVGQRRDGKYHSSIGQRLKCRHRRLESAEQLEQRIPRGPPQLRGIGT